MELDFTKPSQSAIYDADTATAFFKSAGKVESVAKGEIFFAENQTSRSFFIKDDKMFLLLEGEASLMIGKKVIDTVKAGEIFGEMASISQSPRSATAVAKTDCRVISLDKGQFQKAIGKTPEFALMLMSIMINRLRLTVARLSMGNALPSDVEGNECRVFDKAGLAGLVRELGDPVPIGFSANKSIITAGELGVLMYVVLEGRVAISVKNKIVERVGPGGVFGEMALVDRAPRAASAVAETACSLVAINRNDFLDLVKTKPAFGLTLLKSLAERLKYASSHLAPK